ncbi:RNA ligase family protein [Tenacibaculum dicentrarchi]|nr:RNA ligase family protein [Tenacibaculum dicentrarchi]
MKPLGHKNYGSIPHLSSSKLGIGDHFINIGQETILTEKKRDKHDEVFAFEKYDGSNVGIAKINDKIISLTRSGYEASTSKYSHHQKFSRWVEANENIYSEILNNGERITGEWLLQAHGIKYEIHEQLQPIVFFDFFDNKNERQSFDLLNSLYKKFEIQIPRLLHRGDAISVDELIPTLNKGTYGIFSDEKPEGIVYRVERKNKVDFLAKWVRKDFQAGKYIVGKEEHELILNYNS